MNLHKKSHSNFLQNIVKTLNANNSFWTLLLLFVFVHLMLFNINSAEWGDSYRITRAAEYIRQGTYPSDEKRPPLFALILAARPAFLDQIFFGRLVLLGFSIFSFVLFYRLSVMGGLNEKWLNWASLLFIFNNIYLYWSLRVMTDVPFGFFVLLAFYMLKKFKLLTPTNTFLIGLVCGLAVLTRFEGYLLTASVFLFLSLHQNFKNIKDLCNGKKLTTAVLKIVPALCGFSLTVIPYIIYRNPFGSSYLEEPGGRAYDLKMVAIYLLSLICVFGVPVLAVFFRNSKTTLINYLKENLAISVFVLLELILILFWPAAVPRLFVPIIPIIIIIFVLAAQNFFTDQKPSIQEFLGMGCILFLYCVGQLWLKQQFLILDKRFFAINFLFQLILIWAVYRRKINTLIMVSVLINILWSYSAIDMHKDIFISIKNASHYASQNLEGKVGYNDVSSVADWYLNYAKTPENTAKDAARNINGYYYNTEKKSNLEYDKLSESGMDYLLITNEHNTTMTLDLNKRPYLKEIQVFEYNVNSRNFVTRIVEVL